MNSPPHDQPLLLVVEDNPTNLALVRAVLTRAGFKILEAQTAEEARQLLATVRPDMIVMDIQLPGIDGLTFTRQPKADPATATSPIVALTAHAMQEDRQRALDAGCVGYIAKPINTRTFADELTRLLRG